MLKVLKDFFPYCKTFLHGERSILADVPECALLMLQRWEVIAAASSDDKLEVCKKAILHQSVKMCYINMHNLIKYSMNINMYITNYIPCI